MPNNGKLLNPATGRPFRFDYDAVQDKKRRQPPRVRLTSEDRHLPSGDRRKLVATSRDIVRNWTIAAWMVRKHLDYVSTFAFQGRTPNEALNRRLEELVSWWARAANFDVAGRHGLRRFTRLAEARRTLDGDFFPMKLSSGHVQAVEGDRVRTPRGQFARVNGVDPNRITHGVITSKAGRARGYCLHNRHKRGDGFEFDRVVPARHMLAHGYFDRFDQVRGIGLVAPGLNSLQDTHELFEYIKAKSKIAQMFGLKWKLGEEETESPGDVTTENDADGNLDKSKTEIDFGRSPFSVDLDTDEELELFESSQPPQQVLEFTRLLIMVTMKALDLPFSQFDESHSTYSGSRLAWIEYIQSAKSKRGDNRELLNTLLAWRIGLWIVDGELVLPRSFSLDQLRWEWIAKSVPWIDPLKEIAADEKAIAMRVNSRQRICKRQGDDFFDVADELAAENDYLRERGLLSDEPESKPAGPAAKKAGLSGRHPEYVACYKDYLHASV